MTTQARIRLVQSDRFAFAASVSLAACVAVACLFALPLAFAQTAPTTAPEQLTDAQKTELGMLSSWLKDQTLAADKRREAATLLVNKGWSAAEAVLAEVLGGKDATGRLAVADALAGEAGRNGFRVSDKFIDPLIACLGDASEPLRRSAGRALAGFSEQPEVIVRLAALASDTGKPADLRRGVIAALGSMPPSGPAIIDGLVGVLDDRDADLRTRALESLNNVTGVEIATAAARKEWWNQNRGRPMIGWLSRLNQRLRQDNLALRQQRDQLDKRLASAMRSLYDITPPAQQAELLLKCFDDPQPAVRVLAMELVDKTLLVKTLPVPDAVKKAVLDRLADQSPRVRIAAADLIPSLGEPKAGGQLLATMSAETDIAAKCRMIKALGLMRSAEAVAPLLKMLAEAPDQAIVAESAGALGNIAARSQASVTDNEQVVAGLLARYGKLTRDEPVARDAIVGAMADVADLRFAPIFLKNLGDDSASLRLACVHGLANVAPLPANQALLGDEIVTALIGRLGGEPDRGVRLELIGGLAKHSSGKTALKAVFERTNVTAEADESVRKRAWDGLVEMLKTADKATQLTWARQLEDSADPIAAGKLVDLLTAIDLVAAKSDQWTPADLSALAERIAAALMKVKRPAEAASRLDPEYQKIRQAAGDRAAALSKLYFQALLEANQAAPAVTVLKDRLAVGGAAAAESSALADALIQQIKRLLSGGDSPSATAAMALVREVRRQLPEESKSAPWADAFTKAADQVKQALSATTKPE